MPENDDKSYKLCNSLKSDMTNSTLNMRKCKQFADFYKSQTILNMLLLGSSYFIYVNGDFPPYFLFLISLPCSLLAIWSAYQWGRNNKGYELYELYAKKLEKIYRTLQNPDDNK
jgi:hypothetical protein